MKIYKEISELTVQEIRDLAYQSGEDTLNYLTDSEVEKLAEFMDGMEDKNECEFNDYLWYSRDEIAQVLGYNDFAEIIER